jgi:hypothetical protein
MRLSIMEQHVFSSIIEGAAEKILQFIMPLKSVYNGNFGSIEQKCIFEYWKRVKSRKKSLK